jgi:hypothetical protein
VGEKVVRQHTTETAQRTMTLPGGPVVVGLDGDYVRSRQRQQERHFEVVAGKVIEAAATQHRFAFARNAQAASAVAFAQTLATAGVHADTPATVLCDRDAGLGRGYSARRCRGHSRALTFSMMMLLGTSNKK